MNNWRLLLLAVVAVLQPIRSFTEPNLIDGRQECCDHRSNSFTQETKLYENSRKTTPENRHLNSQEDIREDQRRSDAQNRLIRFRERLTVDRTERRVSPESAIRFSTETRFARDQERRQRSADSRQSRQTREDESRRIRERISRDSLTRYEKDALDTRRIRMSRDDTRVGRVTNERVYDKSLGSYDIRRVRDSEDSRRVSVNREIVAERRGKDDLARDESRRDSRISTFRVENRLQHDNNRERGNLGRHLRDNTEENRRSRLLESRMNSVDRENQRTSFRTMSERVEERRQLDQNREYRDRTVITLLESSERIFADRRRESRNTVERVDQSRRNIRDYRTDERIEVQRQHQDESRLSRGRSSERRDSRLNTERRLVRDSRVKDANKQFERTVRSNDRREPTRDIVRASRDITNEGRQDSRASRVSETTNNVLKSLRSDDTRNQRREPSTRSLDRVRSDERIGKKNVRNEKAVKHHRDVRSAQRLDERREQRYGTRMSRGRQITMPRETRDNAERRQETRSTVSPTRFEVNVRSERESRLRERDNGERTMSREQTINRMARDTEQKNDGQLSRTARLAVRANSEERVSRIREERLDVHREAHNNNKARSVKMQRLTRDVSATQRRSDPRRIDSNIRLPRARTVEDTRGARREVSERDESRVLSERISLIRLSRERIEMREARRASTDSPVDVRNFIIKNRGVRMTANSESRINRQQVDSRSQYRVLQRQTRDVRAARSLERRSRETGSRDVRNDAREFRTGEVQPNRYNFAMERMDRTASRNIRIEAELRSDTRAVDNTRRELGDTRFRIFESKVREIDVVDTSDIQNAMSWQMVFYTLQGAYLCGLMMQMLTEKSNKGKSRNITAWWSSASKDLVTVN